MPQSQYATTPCTFTSHVNDMVRCSILSNSHNVHKHSSIPKVKVISCVSA